MGHVLVYKPRAKPCRTELIFLSVYRAQHSTEMYERLFCV